MAEAEKNSKSILAYSLAVFRGGRSSPARLFPCQHHSFIEGSTFTDYELYCRRLTWIPHRYCKVPRGQRSPPPRGPNGDDAPTYRHGHLTRRVARTATVQP